MTTISRTKNGIHILNLIRFPPNFQLVAIMLITVLVIAGFRPGTRAATKTVAGHDHDATNSAAPVNHAVLDFDGDGRTDIAVVRIVGSNLVWYILGSATGFSANYWGDSFSDVSVPGDYDGDGQWDLAVVRRNSGYFYILQSSTHTIRFQQFGLFGDDVRVSQDFDGDHKTDLVAVRRQQSTMIWYLSQSTDGFKFVVFGNGFYDLPVRGDFDGDGKADIAVYRTFPGAPANTFFVLPSSGGPIRAQTFGDHNQDQILPGDFDGDGRTDYAVFRTGGASDAGYWYWIRSSDGQLAFVKFGTGANEFAVPGDYDGDGKTDQAVWRTTGNPTFYQLGSTIGFKGTVFGISTDEALAYSLQTRGPEAEPSR